MPQLTDPVTTLAGIGPARARQLAALGIQTVYDLLAFFPRRYEDRSQISDIADLQPDQPACIKAVVVSQPRTSHIRRGMDLTKLTVADHSSRLNIVYFNQSYRTGQLRYGETYFFYGVIPGDKPGRQMTNPCCEAADAPAHQTRRIVPVYPLTAGITNALLIRTVAQALEACLDDMPEILPASVRVTYELCGVQEAYRSIHAPESMAALARARKRLVFEEFFIFSAGLQLLRATRTADTCLPYPETPLEPFYAALPFHPTGAQMRAIEALQADFRSGVPMNRLLQGDVGSGKTLVAAAGVYLTARAGLQSALMAPTEVLAEQHFRSLAPLLQAFGIRCVLLTGSTKPREKAAVRALLSGGEADFVIGTHALLSEATGFSRLGFVIADEQHRFGVQQRGVLASRGTHPHLLFMSATPIPRTLTLLLYGELNISILDELPPGRQTIETFLVDESMRARINAFIRRQVEEGHQVYIVCPAIEEGEDASLKSAELFAETLQHSVFSDMRVGLLHGRMKSVEKEEVMRAFSAGTISILVSTTVIEVGVDVPNATLIVIENAERFGLSQLHQLRGRVGRGSVKSYCVLFSSNRNPDTQARLKALCATTDGFRIAEQDLALRGPGDFFGSRQHGLPQFKVASLVADLAVLNEARQAAENCLPALMEADCAPLRSRIRMLFSGGEPVLN